MSPYSLGFVVKAAVLMASGLYFYIRYRRQGPVFWISVILLTTGFFDLRFQMELWLQGRSVSDTTHLLLQGAINLMFVAANTVYHYLVLVFYLEISGIIRRYMYALLLIPLLATLMFRTNLYPEFTFDYTFVAGWGALYWLASLALFLTSVIRERNRDKLVYHVAIALMLLSNGAILILAHLQGKEFIEMVNMTWFSIFLAFCLLLLIWVNMRKMLSDLQREAVVRKMDMGTALLHHSFKNSVGKVKVNAWNIRKILSKQTGLSKQTMEEIDGYVQNLFSTYEHMMGMMAKISQSVRNKLVVKAEIVDLAELLDEAVEAARSFPEIDVVSQYKTMSVYIDRALILECLNNLVQNAVEAMHGAGTLTIAAEKQRRHIQVSVTDTGPGLSKEQLSQAFEPFYSTKGKTGKNMGLGLYYVRKVMEAHKGKVKLQSELGQGTTVTLQFKTKKGNRWKKLKCYWLRTMSNGNKR